MDLNFLQVEEIVRRALVEDIGTGDVTTALVVPPGSVSCGRIIAKEEGVVAGLQVASLTFALVAESYSGKSLTARRKMRSKLDPQAWLHTRIKVPGQHWEILFRAEVVDGAFVQPGDLIAEVKGPTAVILTAERTALNFLQRLSGIATKTARFVELVKGTGAKIVDTRKTTPGLRVLEKYAVRVGGGQNHRFGLYDAILIKDNHIRAAGGVREAVERARSNAAHTVKIEVEADDLDQVKQALDAGADMILLDNMSPDMLKQAVPLCKGRATTEGSGGITEENVAAVAKTGVDLISVGALTHSVKALDISLEIAD